MTTLAYGEFSARIHQEGARTRVPLNATIEVTRRCPLACAHCYNNLPMGDADARRRELTTEEHRRLLDGLAEAGCLWILFTGGEILARPDFVEIYQHAKQLGFLITLFTNGTLITPRIADFLAEWRPFSIEITLYGRTKETYERLTGIPGSWERCMRGIDLLQERGLPLKLKAVAVTLNRHEIGAIREFARERGLEFKFDAQMNPRIDCSQSPLAVRLKPEEVVALDLEDADRSAEWTRVTAALPEAPPPEPDGDAEVYQCGGGVHSFAVDPYGGMSICSLSQQDVYDLRGGSFREGWEGFLARVRSKRRTRPSKCLACRLRPVCATCPAVGELEAGDPEAPVEFLCEVTHLRALTTGVEVRPHGDCEFCPGGARHAAILEKAAALREEAPVPTPAPRPALLGLPVLSAPSACGGCGH